MGRRGGESEGGEGEEGEEVILHVQNIRMQCVVYLYAHIHVHTIVYSTYAFCVHQTTDILPPCMSCGSERVCVVGGVREHNTIGINGTSCVCPRCACLCVDIGVCLCGCGVWIFFFTSVKLIEMKSYVLCIPTSVVSYLEKL